MRFEQFVEKMKDISLFETSLVLPFYDSPQQAQRQLSDWTRAGKLVQLRRGLYTLAESYREERPTNFAIANWLVRPSYISLQTALSYYSMIPEHVAAVTNVTTNRPIRIANEFKYFIYRHIKENFFFGYRYYALFRGQSAFIATPEKALLDLIYLTPDADNPAYIHELRLQNLEIIDIAHLHTLVERAAQPKLHRALPHLLDVIREDVEGYVTL